MADKPDAITEKLRVWEPPPDRTRITTLDAHTAGEPLRIVTGGFPEAPGRTILERRAFIKDNLDHLRTALMFEPRGHADMYGCVLTRPVEEGSRFGVIFMHNEGYSTMCGHAVIALAEVAVRTGMVEAVAPVTEIAMDTAAGKVRAFVRIEGGERGEKGKRGEGGEIAAVWFHNVPSFVLAAGRAVDVPGLGTVRYDIAFGGAFYAFVDADALGIAMEERNVRDLIQKGMAVKRAVMASGPIVHPFEKDLGFLYGTIFTGRGHTAGVDSRNVCVFAEGEVDRSPTGTGVSARMALHHSRGEIGVDEPMVIESLIGTRFVGRVVQTVKFGPYDAVIPQVEGRAFITGRHEFLIDPRDPLGAGFILR
ncbi:MAG: proline racemase [Candidatus Aminicenantes bacterium]|nr:proline racemase [Candidatus Aminicenantes bacterium]